METFAPWFDCNALGYICICRDWSAAGVGSRAGSDLRSRPSRLHARVRRGVGRSDGLHLHLARPMRGIGLWPSRGVPDQPLLCLCTEAGADPILKATGVVGLSCVSAARDSNTG